MNLINIFVSFLMAAGLCLAQTKPNIGAMKGPSNITATSAALFGPGGSISFVAIDGASLVVNNGVLTAKAALPTRVVEITQLTAAVATYTLGAAPNAAPELDVFLNGICLSVGVDYSVASNVVTFIGGVQPGATDVLRVVYRTQ